MRQLVMMPPHRDPLARIGFTGPRGLATLAVMALFSAWAVVDVAVAASAAYVPGEVLVKIRGGGSVMGIGRTLVGVKQIRPGRAGIHRMLLEQGVDVGTMVERLHRQPEVEYAQPNYYKHMQAVPDDPRYDQQWGLQNTGQAVQNAAGNGNITGTAGADIQATAAWDVTTGSRAVVVAVLDTGVATLHPDLQTNLWQNPLETPDNGIDDDGNGFVDDVIGADFVHMDGSPVDINGHGTTVASVIGADGNNGLLMTGVDWQVSLMILQIGGADGQATSERVADGIRYAVDHGARIINASFGARAPSIYGDQGFDYVEYDAVKYARDNGVLLVAAACNDGGDNDTLAITGLACVPASYDLDNIIAVAASDQNDDLASFSSWGAATVDIAAPGRNILVATPEYIPIAQAVVTTTATATAPINLSGRRDCWALASLDGPLPSSLVGFADRLVLEGSADQAQWVNLGSVGTYANDLYNFPVLRGDLAAFDETSTVYLRLRLYSGDLPAPSDLPAHIQGVSCYGPYQTNGGVGIGNGTSLSAPMVAGVAALVLAHPDLGGLGMPALRSAILTGAEQVTSLASFVADGGRRLNAWGALQTALGNPVTPRQTQSQDQNVIDNASANSVAGGGGALGPYLPLLLVPRLVRRRIPRGPLTAGFGPRTRRA